MPKKRVQSSSAGPESETVSAAASSSAEPAKEPTPPLQVFYCGSQSLFLQSDFCDPNCHTHSFVQVCSFPLEYCEFGSSLTRCKEWLKAEQPDQFDKYYSDGMFPPFPPFVNLVLEKEYPS